MTTIDTNDVTGLLDSVGRISAAARESISSAFSSVEELRAATLDELCELDGMSKTLARRILHAAEQVAEPKEVGSFRHGDKRKNIPTDEHAHLIDTVGDGQPDTLRYPRDTDLDPQLVWRGKDALDREPLQVPIVPIYIQEKIDPRVIVENLRNTAANQSDEPELSLFDDFDGIDDPLAAIEHYEHDANWSNRMILGDALIAMTSLAEKEALKGKVQTIYFDPPYGIKFQSNWQVSTRENTVKDGAEVTPQPEQVRAFRDTWKDGVNSYLTYLRDRLVVARTLLSQSGSVFVQISDDNLHVVRNLLDEVFGPQNYVSTITFQKTESASGSGLSTVADFILWYSRDKPQMKYRPLYKNKSLGSEGATKYRKKLLADGTVLPLTREERAGLVALPAGSRAFRDDDNLTSQRRARDGDLYEFEFEGKSYTPGAGTWKTNRVGMERLAAAGRINNSESALYYIRYFDDFDVYPINNVWTDVGGIQSRSDPKVYVVQTATKIIERCILMTTDPGDLIVDPTCGAATSAAVAERWGRRWITIDTSRVAMALARRRLMGARFPYFTLADSPAGAAAEASESGREVREPEDGWKNDLRRGFVHRRALHVMLSTIANCEEIDAAKTPGEAERSIRRAADFEVLYDRPHIDENTVRVAGPFTVETLSPHRTVAPNTESTDGDFVELILDNLSRAGVQNGYRNERLELGWLEPYAGTWIHAIGGFTDDDGDSKTVAISIGPETGTVGREHVAEATKEAAREVRADLLLVCAYAFDAGAGEQATTETGNEHIFNVGGQRQAGRLRVLNVRVNTDLMMGDDLKNTGAGNLFTVFGEPDITITAIDDESIEVTLHGLDIYDPNKGTVRSTDPKDIACWFIDTNYSGDSFFVRHAYFTGGANEPFEALRKALKAEINDEAWGALYRTTSLPFRKPQTGKIAVKAINHYGDEALSVFSV
jgi:adenine-specific DNA-methyltransferase